jgi:hypothetical protein
VFFDLDQTYQRKKLDKEAEKNLFKKFHFEKYKNEIRMWYRNLQRTADKWLKQVLE